MPRGSRKKSYESTYHIMCRANGEELLFRNDLDKEKYLEIMREYQKVYHFKVYAYCVMDTHCHFIIYSNGSDISKVMHHINQKYAQGHYNKVYNRRGHVFNDRFKSKIIDDDIYLLSAWGYIHNNPYAIENYKESVEKYPYSSMSIYLGKSKDKYGLIDMNLISGMLSKNNFQARKKMVKLVKDCNDDAVKEEIEFLLEKQEYRSEKKCLLKNEEPKNVLNFVAKFIECKEEIFYIKNKKSTFTMRCLGVFMLKAVCGLTDKKIAQIMGNITQSSISRMLKKSIELIELDKYKNLFYIYLESL